MRPFPVIPVSPILPLFLLFLFFSPFLSARDAGHLFSVIEGTPRVVSKLCGDAAFELGGFYYFTPDPKNKKRTLLCAEAIERHPGRSTILLPRSDAPVTIDGSWRLADGIDGALLYDPAAPFTDMQDIYGRVLTEKRKSLFVDAAGRIAAPRFVWRSGAWEAVMPLKELFLLRLEIDNTFVLEVRSTAPIEGSVTEPARFFDMVAERLAPKKIAAGVMVTGAGLSRIAVPRLALDPAQSDRYGRYRIEIQREKAPEKKPRTRTEKLDLPGISARFIAEDEPFFLLELTISRATLDPDDAEKLTLFLRRVLPTTITVNP